MLQALANSIQGKTAPVNIGTPLKITQPATPAPSTTGKSTGTSLPTDPDYQNAAAQLLAAHNSYLGNVAAQKQQLESQYTDATNQAAQQEPNRNRAILNNFAGRGMAYSSGYGTALGNENQAYQHLLSQLNQSHDYGLSDITRQQGDYESQYALQQEALRNAATQRLAAQAGSLNLLPSGPTTNPNILAALLQGYYGG